MKKLIQILISKFIALAVVVAPLNTSVFAYGNCAGPEDTTKPNEPGCECINDYPNISCGPKRTQYDTYQICKGGLDTGVISCDDSNNKRIGWEYVCTSASIDTGSVLLCIAIVIVDIPAIALCCAGTLGLGCVGCLIGLGVATIAGCEMCDGMWQCNGVLENAKSPINSGTYKCTDCSDCPA
jgi:hypothetical protein